MTRKKRIVSARAGRVRTVIDEPILPDESPEEDPFQFALQEFGEDAGLTLHVYRYDPMTGKARYAKSVPFQKEIHGLEWLQRMFGAGDYLLRFYDSEGKSKNRTVSVDDDPSRRETVAPPAPSSNRDELVSILREQNNLILSALLKGGAQQAPAPAAENSVTLKILDAILPQVFQKQDISVPLLSMLEKGIAIAMDAKSDSEGGMAGLIRSVAKELGPVLGEFARARMMAPPPPPFSPPVMRPPALNPGNENSGGPPPYSPPPAPSPPPSPPNGEAPATPEETARAMVEGTVRCGVELVERAAQAKEKPEDVGDWILGEIPPNYYDHLAGLTYERLTTINPRYASLERTWIEAVLTHLRKEAQGGAEVGEEEEHGSD